MGENIEEPIYTCTDRMSGFQPGDSGTFFPVFVADLSPSAPTSSYASSNCFGQMDFAFEITSETSFDVTLTLGDKKSKACHEYLMFANTETWHMEVFYFPGTHKLSFNMPSAIE